MFICRQKNMQKMKGSTKHPQNMTIIYVIPSVTRFTEFKWLQASEMEREAAFAIFHKSTLAKSIVHFDTMGRSSIDREWPSLILKVSDRTEYTLWPIFFAFEDREQITNLFVETFGRLKATLKVSHDQTLKASHDQTLKASHDQTLQPKTLWEKVML